jgi:hypothetical protein
MKRRLAVVLVVAVAAIAGTAGSATATKSGELHVTKECSQYDGTVGSFCTITSSNVPAIRAEMRVVYLQVPANGVLDADIVLTAKGRSVAFGHVLLDLTTAQGSVTLSGETAQHTFSADAVVSVDADGVWHWDGTYAVT